MSAFKKLYIHKPVTFIPFIEVVDVLLLIFMAE